LFYEIKNFIVLTKKDTWQTKYTRGVQIGKRSVYIWNYKCFPNILGKSVCILKFVLWN